MSRIFLKERKYRFFDYIKRADTIFSVIDIDHALYVKGKKVASVFIAAEGWANDVFMEDDDYISEVKKVLEDWIKYYGFKGDIEIHKNNFKAIK